MSRRFRWLLAILVTVFVLLTAGTIAGRRNCPGAGLAFTEERREFHRLKNRTLTPRPDNFDSRVTLAALLQPGDDSARWSETRAARIEGYVVSINSAWVELANCYVRRDIHLNVALRPDAPSREQVVVEITPRFRDAQASLGNDWSEENLKRTLLGRWCSFEGWLLFDRSHAKESENVMPGREENWRATAWEIHPVTNFQLIK